MEGVITTEYKECWKRAGDNKFQFKECPFCKCEGKPTTAVPRPDSNEPGVLWFRFKDTLSAVEYGISGLCQEHQDSTFVEPEE